MKLFRTALFVAIMSTTALTTLEADAAEYKYRRYDKVAGFGDSTRIDSVSGYVYAGKFFQWFGKKTACDKSAPQACYVTQTSAQAVETAWKVGAEVVAKSTFSWGGVDGKLVGEYARKTTDTDTFAVTTYISPGYTAEASTYVDRDLVKTSYYGVWVRIADGVRCPGTILLNCAKYEWKPQEFLGNIEGLLQRSGEQTFTFLIYPTGKRPAYKLEAD